jgi:cobalt/nickel transport system permease protein
MTMALVLILQALLLGDGGTLALGANVLNMALLPAGLVALSRRAGWLTGANLKAAHRELAVVSALSAASIVLAAALIVVEVALFRTGGELTGWTAFAQQMLSVHLLIAVGEGAATGLVAVTLAWLASPAKSLTLRPAFVTAALAILTALAIPFSSELPDGYEYAAERSGLLK